MKNKLLIYVVCPDRNDPIGGVKQLYRLVDILNTIGYDAFIIHGKTATKVKWFDHQIPIKYFPYLHIWLNRQKAKKKKRTPLFFKTLLKDKRMPETDSIIVFPEVYGPNVNKIVPNNKVVIFNQNCYYTFDHFGLSGKGGPYTHPNTLGSIVVSENSLAYLQYSFPSHPVFRIRLSISKVFEYSSTKKKQIAYMPRKLAEDFIQIFNLLNNRINLEEWSFVPIDNMSEEDVAKVLKDSSIFLSFNHREGFGLPPVEAMACGCYVIGYAGNAGKEYFRPEFSSLIEDRNVLQFAMEVERVINQYDINPTAIAGKALAASDYVLANYNKNNEFNDIKAAWQKITAQLK
jgi:glycosyltransferase involved in cell wall biosynthesis